MMTGEGEKIRIGISSCLLGNMVRYDGGHKHDPFITGTLGNYCEFVPVCPEVECGLPIPREAMRLVGAVDIPRLITTKTGVDHTEQMQTWSRKRLEELEKEGFCGFIFKSRSPSSGMERVKKLLLLAHSEKLYRQLGRVVSQAGKLDSASMFSTYQKGLMTAMKLKPTVKKHVNVLMHMMGYFKKVLSAAEKRELLEVIERFKGAHVPLIAPLTLLNHYVRKYGETYLLRQYYLNLHPAELKLRNHA